MQFKQIRHATCMLTIQEKRLLVDPMLSPKGVLPAIEGVPNAQNNPLVDLPVPVEELLQCDAIIVTHMHRDHFDTAAAEWLPKQLPVFCQPEDEKKLTELGFAQVIPVKTQVVWQGIRICRTKARHGHGTLALQMAPSSGYILSAQGDPTVYLTGDTVWCSYIKKAINRHHPDNIVCYSGEARFAKGRPITMDKVDIVSVCANAPGAKVIAIHMEAWNHCRLARETLSEYVTANNLQNQVYIPQNGEEITLDITACQGL